MIAAKNAIYEKNCMVEWRTEVAWVRLDGTADDELAELVAYGRLYVPPEARCTRGSAEVVGARSKRRAALLPDGGRCLEFLRASK